MQPETDQHREEVRLGERLIRALWLSALAPNGHLPQPTIKRIRAIKAIVASWEAEIDV